jgi:hypothetical protein
MRPILPAVALAILFAGCSKSPKPEVSETASVGSAPMPAAAKITQFYTTTPSLARGESGLVCYGVENAKSVWLSPPRKELIVTQARCEEIAPKATTKYTLTAEGASGPAATMDLTVNVDPPHAPHVRMIVEVQFTTLDLKRGEALGICYTAENAQKVEIAPIGYHNGSGKHCTMDHPLKTTTYTVTAIGGGGDRDKEQATVQVH